MVPWIALWAVGLNLGAVAAVRDGRRTTVFLFVAPFVLLAAANAWLVRAQS